MSKIDWFKSELGNFENEEIKDFAVLCINGLPDYFFDVCASSTGKHHPETDLLEHGLVYHTKACAAILEYILEIDKRNSLFGFDARMRDMMRCAMLLHDGLKMGASQEEYEAAAEKRTCFMHPLFAQKYVLSHRDCGLISRKEISKIGQLIASHMGSWNVSEHESGRLPVPMLPEEKIIHLADYLASRKDIIIKNPEFYFVIVNEIGKGERVKAM